MWRSVRVSSQLLVAHWAHLESFSFIGAWSSSPEWYLRVLLTQVACFYLMSKPRMIYIYVCVYVHICI